MRGQKAPGIPDITYMRAEGGLSADFKREVEYVRQKTNSLPCMQKTF